MQRLSGWQDRSMLMRSPALPKDISRVIRADNYGNSSWDKTARITTVLADGTERAFFVKVINSSSDF